MNWKPLTEEADIETIISKSNSRPQVIFKHSTTCSISSVVKSRLDKGATLENIDFYFLDLLRYRSVSNKVAETFNIHHESPQALIIKNGKCVYDESHMSINFQEILTSASF